MKGKIFKSVEEFKKYSIEYAVSLGRRQPMHKMHYDSICEILDAGLKLVYVVGSTNTAFKSDGSVDVLFNPIKNPLTFNQQKEQFFYAFPEISERDLIITAMDDIGNLSLWSEELRNILNKYNILERSALHFRGKEDDREEVRFTLAEEEMVLQDSWPVDALPYFGINVWYSKNPTKKDYDYHSSNLRTKPIEENKDIVVAADYLTEKIRNAREKNPDKSLIKDVPLTMFDLTLDRMRKEMNVGTKQIVGSISGEVNLRSLVKTTEELLDKR